MNSPSPIAPRYDVIVIGTGAGGGPLLLSLARAGRKVLVLERGDVLPREMENWSTRAVFRENRYKPKESWFLPDGRPFPAPCHYYVGGNTKLYGAALMRLRPADFGEIRHAGGVSPAWPVSYDEMEPYYLAAERLFRVRGTRGFDPTDGAASGPYSHAAIRHEPRVQTLWDDLLGLGLHPFPMPLAILLDESLEEGAVRPPDSSCIRCATCGGYPCYLGAKADAEVICIGPAAKLPNVTLLTGARAERLETDASGREVTAVVVSRGGRTESYSADIVVVAAGAVNSAALLLRSASDRHPQGLANGSGVVGRHLMLHNVSSFLAVSTTQHDTRFQKTIGVNDFYGKDPEGDFPLGNVQLLARSKAEMLSPEAVRQAGMSAAELEKHALDFCVMTEDLPDPENRITLRADGSYQVAYAPNNLEGRNRLVAKLRGWVPKLRCRPELVSTSAYAGSDGVGWTLNHQCGTVRFGRDPRTSALDESCRAHGVENLYVVDASCFPSSGAVNPSLTIIANSLRVADILQKRLGE